MTIAEFLLARISEDEAWARDHEQAGDFLGFIEDVAARVLAECEAKRRIVVRHTNCDDTSFGDPCDDLRDTASVYADHPDFDPAWRVTD